MAHVFTKYFSPLDIKLAYFRVNQWGYSQIKDQIGLRKFNSDLELNAEKLSKKVCLGMFTPSRGFKFYMPKASNTFRTQTQLVVEDAIVYQAIANKLAENCFNDLNKHNNHVFGSILSESCKRGVELLNDIEPHFNFFKEWGPLHKKFRDSVIKSIEKDQSVFKLETDITGFFDAIPHYNLFRVLQNEFGLEEEVVDLLKGCLDKWSGTRDGATHGVGIPQGPAPSYLLANMFLHNLDSQLISQGLAYFRYMDDIKIYGFEKKKMQKLLHTIDKYTKSNGLSINSKKTSIDRIDNQSKQEILKSLKKLSTLSIYSSDEFETNDTKSIKKSKEELIEDIEKVKNKLKEVIYTDKDRNKCFDAKFEDVDLIQQSVRFNDAVVEFKESNKEFSPDEDLIDYWLLGVRTFYWRASGLLMSLSHYKGNETVKEGLIRLYEDFEDYEWVRFYLITNLSFNHEFSQNELKDIFLNFLREEIHELPRVALYRLLLVHSKGRELNDEIQKELNNEDSEHIIKVIDDFRKNKFFGASQRASLSDFFDY